MPPPLRLAVATLIDWETPYLPAHLRWHIVRIASFIMTQPRQIIKGATYLLTRTVLHRRFLLRPDAATTNHILYSLAVTAERYQIQIHSFCAMPTHIQLVVTDPNGVLPYFTRNFHRLVAMGVKLLRHWEGAVWDNARTGVVRLLTPEAIAEKIAHTLANPVLVRAVSRASEWPGAKNLATAIGSNQVFRTQRPAIYFRSKNAQWPESIQWRIHTPPMITDAIAFQENILARIRSEEKKAFPNGRRFSKKQQHRLATISPNERAKSQRVKCKSTPTFAVGHGNQDAFELARAAERKFRLAYRKSLTQWQSGERHVSFPRGTWWMRVFHQANTDDPMFEHDILGRLPKKPLNDPLGISTPN